MKKNLLLLLLCSCGFTPMYVGSDADIYVAPISGINGIELRNALNAKFGGAHDETAKYKYPTSTELDPNTTYYELDSEQKILTKVDSPKANEILKSTGQEPIDWQIENM